MQEILLFCFNREGSCFTEYKLYRNSAKLHHNPFRCVTISYECSKRDG